jgi:hypothetical protein
MKFEKSCLEFEVKSLDEVQVVLRSWYGVLNRFQDFKERVYRLSQYRLITVSLEGHQRPKEVVVLRLIAPQNLLDRLLNELMSQGLECLVQVLVPGFMAKCRLQKKLYACPAVTK